MGTEPEEVKKPVEPVVLSLYQVKFLFRPHKDAAPQDKSTFVVAKSETEATAHLNAKVGSEITGIRVIARDLEIAGVRRVAE